MRHDLSVLIVSRSLMLICVFVDIVSVRLLACCFPEITMAAIADVQLTNGCCLRDCGVERFRPLWPNRVSARRCTHELISQGVIGRRQDWRSWAWEDDEKGATAVRLHVPLLGSVVAIVCRHPHPCRLHQCRLHRLPISRYVYSHHVTPAGRCDPLSGGSIL